MALGCNTSKHVRFSLFSSAWRCHSAFYGDFEQRNLLFVYRIRFSILLEIEKYFCFWLQVKEELPTLRRFYGTEGPKRKGQLHVVIQALCAGLLLGFSRCHDHLTS
jgi:hypothetical protein